MANDPADRIEGEDDDPIARLRHIRDRNAKRFKTAQAYFAYLRTVPSAAELLLRMKEQSAKVPVSRRRRRLAKA